MIESGFPWNALGTKLKAIDSQFVEVSNEYANIHDSIERLEGEIGGIGKEVEEIRSSQGSLTDRIRQVVREELPAMQDRWLIATGSLVLVLVGIVISVINSKVAKDLLAQHGVWFGPVLVVVSMGVFWWARRRRNEKTNRRLQSMINSPRYRGRFDSPRHRERPSRRLLIHKPERRTRCLWLRWTIQSVDGGSGAGSQ